MKYTPGPWQAEIGDNPADPDGDLWVVDSDQGSVADITSDSEHAEANARLIAAAPNMLAALKALVGMSGAWDGEDVTAYGVWDTAKAAIHKAEGLQ